MPWKVDPPKCPGCSQKMSYGQIAAFGYLTVLGPRVRALEPKPGTEKKVELTCDKNETYEYTVTYVQGE